MKKSVILLIIIVYIGSVLAVGLLGAAMNFGEQVKYVNKIEYLPEGTLDPKTSEDSEKKTYITAGSTKKEIVYTSRRTVGKELLDVSIGDYIMYDAETDKFEAVTFEVRFRVYPDDAKTKTLSFSFDESKIYDKENNPNGTIKVTKDAKGDSFTVTFYKNDTVTFLVSPTVQGGGADVSLYVKITAQKKDKPTA